MAEIEFFAVEEEIVEVVSWLLDQRCTLIPDMHYDSTTIARLTQLSEIRQVGVSTPHFFVIREDLLESPLSMREVTTTDKHFFYIDPRTGGPSLQLYWGRHVEKEGRQHLSASWLSYYNWYEDSVTGERKKVSKALLDIYFDCGKIIRAKCRKIQPGKREFWISQTVEELVRSGTILVGLEGMPVDQILNAPKADRDTSRSRMPSGTKS
jgi:hypothetical protein